MVTSESHIRKATVVIGTGFHRWVLGPAANSPLSGWVTLLKSVASRLRVAAPEPDSARLALSWETLLLCMVRDGYLKPETRGMEKPS